MLPCSLSHGKILGGTWQGQTHQKEAGAEWLHKALHIGMGWGSDSPPSLGVPWPLRGTGGKRSVPLPVIILAVEMIADMVGFSWALVRVPQAL